MGPLSTHPHKTEGDDGSGFIQWHQRWGASGVLGGPTLLRLSLCWETEVLRFYEPESGEYLQNFEAEQADRERAEARIRELQEKLERREWES